MNTPPDNLETRKRLLRTALECIEGEIDIEIDANEAVTITGTVRQETDPNSNIRGRDFTEGKLALRILELLQREKKAFSSATIARKLGYRTNPSYLRQVLKQMVDTGKIGWSNEGGYHALDRISLTEGVRDATTPPT